MYEHRTLSRKSVYYKTDMFRLIAIIGGRKDAYGKIYRIYIPYSIHGIRYFSLHRSVQTDYGVQQASNSTKTGVSFVIGKPAAA